MLDIADLKDKRLIHFALQYLQANLDPDDAAQLLEHDMSTPGVITDEQLGHISHRLDQLLERYADQELDPDDLKLIELAREEYQSRTSVDDIEIDDDAVVSRGDEGAFVAAWVWVRYPEEDKPEWSMEDQANWVIEAATRLLYDEHGNVVKDLPLTGEQEHALWVVVDGLPVYLDKWKTGRGSINWILENTPEVVQAKLNAAMADVEDAYLTLGRPLPIKEIPNAK